MKRLSGSCIFTYNLLQCRAVWLYLLYMRCISSVNEATSSRRDETLRTTEHGHATKRHREGKIDNWRIWYFNEKNAIGYDPTGTVREDAQLAFFILWLEWERTDDAQERCISVIGRVRELYRGSNRSGSRPKGLPCLFIVARIAAGLKGAIKNVRRPPYATKNQSSLYRL